YNLLFKNKIGESSLDIHRSYGVGAQFNMSESWSFYGSLTRANGSDYQENYKYSVGTRFVF
uniref:autotransporter outer membrane beta-barrel domain-containing protein n=1 Tax=uncultured Sutterella sp. TaxID=286133 RepID=UPI00266C4785